MHLLSCHYKGLSDVQDLRLLGPWYGAEFGFYCLPPPGLAPDLPDGLVNSKFWADRSSLGYSQRGNYTPSVTVLRMAKLALLISYLVGIYVLFQPIDIRSAWLNTSDLLLNQGAQSFVKSAHLMSSHAYLLFNLLHGSFPGCSACRGQRLGQPAVQLLVSISLANCADQEAFEVRTCTNSSCLDISAD